MDDCLIECCQYHAETCQGFFSGCTFLAQECDVITCNSYTHEKPKGNHKPDIKAPKTMEMTRHHSIVF